MDNYISSTWKGIADLQYDFGGHVAHQASFLILSAPRYPKIGKPQLFLAIFSLKVFLKFSPYPSPQIDNNSFYVSVATKVNYSK